MPRRVESRVPELRIEVSRFCTAALSLQQSYRASIGCRCCTGGEGESRTPKAFYTRRFSRPLPSPIGLPLHCSSPALERCLFVSWTPFHRCPRVAGKWWSCRESNPISLIASQVAQTAGQPLDPFNVGISPTTIGTCLCGSTGKDRMSHHTRSVLVIGFAPILYGS